LVPFVSLACLAAGLGWFGLELITFSQQDERLPENLTVAEIASGGLLPSEAVAEWERVYAEPVILYYNNSPILLDPSSIGYRVNWQSMLAEALNATDTEGGFWIRFLNHLTRQEIEAPITVPIQAEYQRSLLEQFLLDVSARYDQSPGAAGFDTQTLTTFTGNTGAQLNIDEAITWIDAALNDPENRVVSLPVGGADASRPSLDTLEAMIIEYLDSQGFIYDGTTTVGSVYVLDLETGEEISILGDVAYSAASTMKLAILIDYFRNLDTDPTPEEAWLLAQSLLCSENASSNLLMTILGGGNDVFAGIASVTRTAQAAGARNTFITAPFATVPGETFGSSNAPPVTTPNPQFDAQPDPFNQTTAEDMGSLMIMIYDCANFGSGLMIAFPNEFTQTECRRMLELMTANDLLRLLQGGLPRGVEISHKNGWLNNMVGEAGIVYPVNGRTYVISVFLWEDTDQVNYARLWPLVEGISRAAWNHFSPESPLLSPREDLPATAQECEGNYLPPSAEVVNLDDIDSWRADP
jgi:hypothetical protein